jgi:hypothetical protein
MRTLGVVRGEECRPLRKLIDFLFGSDSRDTLRCRTSAGSVRLTGSCPFWTAGGGLDGLAGVPRTVTPCSDCDAGAD